MIEWLRKCVREGEGRLLLTAERQLMIVGGWMASEKSPFGDHPGNCFRQENQKMLHSWVNLEERGNLQWLPTRHLGRGRWGPQPTAS